MSHGGLVPVKWTAPEAVCFMKYSTAILGAPIGSPEFCGEYIEAKRKAACSLLHLLPPLCEPQVSILLLRHCDIGFVICPI